MQGLRPCFFSVAALPRSKLRQGGDGEEPPSFLRLASQQEKPLKHADAVGINS